MNIKEKIDKIFRELFVFLYYIVFKGSVAKYRTSYTHTGRIEDINTKFTIVGSNFHVGYVTKINPTLQNHRNPKSCRARSVFVLCLCYG